MDERVSPDRPGEAPAPPHGRARRVWPLLLTLLVLAAIGWTIWRRPGASGPGRHGQAPPQAVGVATVGRGDIPVVYAGLGTVTPLATVTVRTQINGQLQTVGFREGQIVRQGDFLAQIDPRPYEAALAQARGTLVHDQGLLQQAETDYRRYAQLNRQDSISRQQVEDQLFLVHQYQGSVAADQAAIQAQQVNLIYCHITSPVEGRVGLRQVDPGNYVQTSDTNGIVVVTQLVPISVIFTLPEDDVPDIMAALRRGAALPVAAYDRANLHHLADGTLETLDNQIDTTTGTVKLRAIFSNADYTLFPNQFVNARLEVRVVRGAVTVANAAIQTGSPGTFVYVVGKDDVVSVRPIRTGVADAAVTEVVSGLTPGERVVVDGADRLKDGTRVMVPGSQPATPSSDQPDGSGARPRRHRAGPGKPG